MNSITNSNNTATIGVGHIITTGNTTGTSTISISCMICHMPITLCDNTIYSTPYFCIDCIHNLRSLIDREKQIKII